MLLPFRSMYCWRIFDSPIPVELLPESLGLMLFVTETVFPSEVILICRNERKFLVQRDNGVSLVLQHIPVYAGQFVDETAGLLIFVLAYEAVEDVQRIEQEMGVYLLLEFQVPVLRLVGFFPFLEH